MRKALIQSLIKIAGADERLMLLTADLGYLVIEEFIQNFPDRFLNVGVAEQNMVGIATGLAEAGFIPYVYSITPFAALRPFEFIRNGPVYHNLPVRIVGVGQGVEYGINGLSHYALEDIGVLRTQPNLTIIAPADNAQTQSAVERTHNLPGPIYFRLSKDDIEIPELEGKFEIGQVQLLGNGADLLIISSGAITQEAIKAARILAKTGCYATILVISGISPAPEKQLIEALSRFHHVFTLEAHYATGGIGSLVAEVAAENHLSLKLTRFGFNSILNDTVGSAASIYALHDLSSEKVAGRIQAILENHV
jgi:transketolase